MDSNLHAVEEERRRVKAECLGVQAQLGLIQGNTIRTQAIRSQLKARQSELQARLTALKAQSKQMRLSAMADGTGITPGDTTSALMVAWQWLRRLGADGLVAYSEAEFRALDTMRECVNLSGRPSAAERVEAAEKAADTAASSALVSTLEELRAMTQRCDTLRQNLDAANERIASLKARHEHYEGRIAAGAERRREMVVTLHALVTCENDGRLSDEAYDARMDAVVRKARTLVSLERAAILAGKEGT